MFNDVLQEDVVESEWDSYLNRIVFIPDFNSKYPVWGKIVRQYIDNYTDKNSALILYVDNIEAYRECVEEIGRLISGYNINVFVEDKKKFSLKQIISKATGYITTRELINISALDYCNDNTIVFNGMGNKIFNN